MQNKWVRVAADLVMLLVLCAYIFLGVAKVPFHGDESTFIALAQDYFDLVYERRVISMRFTRPVTEYMWLHKMTGTINPFSIGLAADVVGISSEELPNLWIWRVSAADGLSARDYADLMWETNVDAGALPDNRILHVARIPSAIFTALSVVIVFLTARRLTSVWFAAWITAVLYATHPAILLNGRRAMQEGSMLFAQAVIVALALYAIRVQKREVAPGASLTVPYLLLGAAVGLGMAAKHTTVLIGGMAFLGVAVAPLREGSLLSRDFWRFHIVPLIGAGLFAVGVFYVLTPVWWNWRIIAILGLITGACAAGSVRGRGGWAVSAAAVISVIGIALTSSGLGQDLLYAPFTIVEGRIALMMHQLEVGAFTGPVDRIGFMLQEVFMPSTQYYEAPIWAEIDVITRQIAEYERAGLNGRGGVVWALMVVALVVIGGWALARRLPNAEALLLIMLVVGPMVALWVTNPLPWQRYYLMLHGPVAMIAGVGADRVWGWVNRERIRD